LKGIRDVPHCSSISIITKYIMLAICLVLAPFSAHSAELPQKYQEGGTVLALRGQGILNYAIFFDVYQAGLYMPAGTPSNQVLKDVAKRLELHYNYDIAAKDIVTAAREILARNWEPEILAAENEKLDLINRTYVDVGPGDSYALTYLPGRGTELSLNGKPQVTIPGAQFGALMFSIWLGKEPLEAGLRDTLLGYD
jgi:hypothetical protein